MDRLPAHVAYALWPQTAHCEIEENPETGDKELNLSVNIHCNKKQWARLVQRIVEPMKSDLIKKFQSLFYMSVRLTIHVKFAGRIYEEEIREEIYS